MARLTITESARADLQEIRTYIAKDNPAAARRVVERLRAQARKLAATPGIGRSRKDLRPDLFSFPVGKHVLFYRPQPGGIVLVRVIHGARDLPALFSATSPRSCGLPAPCRQNLVCDVRTACYHPGMTDDDQQNLFGELPALTPPSRVQQRLIRSAVEIEADDPDAILFQHTVFCQTGLPYRNPGEAVRLWQRSQGAANLEVEAGRAFHPGERCFVDVGLPFGPKPRLILVYLNAEALRTGSPVVEVEDSLTAFVCRIGLSRDGRSIRTVKDQLSRLSAAEIRLAVTYGEAQTRQVNAHIVGEFDLWFPKDERQRVLWPTTVTLDPRYFQSLQRHAVPLDERAVAALSHSAMALDIYRMVGAAPAPH